MKYFWFHFALLNPVCLQVLEPAFQWTKWTRENSILVTNSNLTRLLELIVWDRSDLKSDFQKKPNQSPILAFLATLFGYRSQVGSVLKPLLKKKTKKRFRQKFGKSSQKQLWRPIPPGISHQIAGLSSVCLRTNFQVSKFLFYKIFVLDCMSLFLETYVCKVGFEVKSVPKFFQNWIWGQIRHETSCHVNPCFWDRFSNVGFEVKSVPKFFQRWIWGRIRPESRIFRKSDFSKVGSEVKSVAKHPSQNT